MRASPIPSQRFPWAVPSWGSSPQIHFPWWRWRPRIGKAYICILITTSGFVLNSTCLQFTLGQTLCKQRQICNGSFWVPWPKLFEESLGYFTDVLILLSFGGSSRHFFQSSPNLKKKNTHVYVFVSECKMRKCFVHKIAFQIKSYLIPPPLLWGTLLLFWGCWPPNPAGLPPLICMFAVFIKPIICAGFAVLATAIFLCVKWFSREFLRFLLIKSWLKW